MKSFFGRFLNKIWTLKVNILTLFLSLLSVAFFCIISFTYSKDYESIMHFAKGIARRRTSIVLSKFETIALASERQTEVAAGFFPEIEPLVFENKALISYMLNIIKYDPNFSNFYIGLPNGTFIGALDRTSLLQRNFLTEPTKPLPKEAAYSLIYVDVTTIPPMNRWFYLNSSFAEIAAEALPVSDFNTLQRPWYVGAKKTGSLYWTGLYPFHPSLEKGISIGNPFYDANGQLTAVIGADLTFTLISKFLSEQKIGKSGRVFILDHSGNIVAPNFPKELSSTSVITPDLITAVYQHYAKDPAEPDFVIKYNDVEYLAYVA